MSKLIKEAMELNQVQEGNLVEYSYNRLLQMMDESKDGYAFVTPYRASKKSPDNPEKKVPVSTNENERNWSKFVSRLQSLGTGFVKLWGGTIEDKGTPAEKAVFEHTAFIRDIDRETAKKLGIEFGQEAVLWGKKGVGNFCVDTNPDHAGHYDDDFRIGDNLSLEKLGKYFTQLKGGKRSDQDIPNIRRRFRVMDADE